MTVTKYFENMTEARRIASRLVAERLETRREGRRVSVTLAALPAYHMARVKAAGWQVEL